jgi:methylase of polypeptide subunit release factors
MRSVDATATLRPYPARRVRRPVQIRLTEDTYPLEPSPEQSWLPIAFRAFAAVARRVAVEDMLILGTGNGVDALGAAEILPRLRSLTATDLYAPCVDVARENVLANVLDGHGVAVAFHVGDLLGAVRPDQRFDLIYENLPNLPASSRLEVDRKSVV